jgi:Tfp pilus assembly protein PilN
MIKINLSNAKKQVDISNIGGFDFTKLKIKAVLLVIVLIYIPDFVLVPMWEEERTLVGQAIDAKQAELSSLKRKVSQSQDLEKQIRELKAQEEGLEKKLAAVKQAISEKRNPAPILLYIAKNMPAELWIKELDMNQEELIIKGEALDYVSIGNFVTALKSSVFIRDANITSTNSAVRESDKRRIETFEVKFGIARFDQ